MKPIWKYPLFTYSLGLSIAVILFFIGVITIDLFKNNNVELCKSSSCFKSFLLIYDFPISIAKVSFAILGFIALVYKSEQTQRQIYIAQDQNTYNNFFQHRAMVYKEITESIENHKLLRLQNFNRLYNLIFPNNKPDSFTFKADFNKINEIFGGFYLRIFKYSPLRYFETNYRIFDDLTIVDVASLSEKLDTSFSEMLESIGFLLEVNSDFMDLERLKEVYHDIEQEELDEAESVMVSPICYHSLLVDLRHVIDAINRVSFSNNIENQLSFYSTGSKVLSENYNITHSVGYIWSQIYFAKRTLIKKMKISSTN